MNERPREFLPYSQAFGGAPLLGSNIVRMVFLDEAGISNPAQEPFLVVAGVIIHADKQWQLLQRRLVAMANKYAPPGAPSTFCFHAMDLFHGGPFFTRDRYDKETRWKILDELVGLPAEFNLPVVGAFADREASPLGLKETYADTFAEVLTGVEAYMRMLPDRDEVASVILEDNDQIRHQVRDTQALMKDQGNLYHLPAHERDSRWLTRIVGEPHFENKGPSSILQIADACAFVAKRFLMDKPEAPRFARAFMSQVVHLHKTMTDRDEAEGRLF